MEHNLCSFEKKFIDIIRIKKYSPATEKSYLYHWKKFKEFKKNVHETKLSSQDINDYLVFLVNSDVSDSYYNQAINSIRFMFKYVFNRKIKNYLVLRPKRAKTQPVILDYMEVKSMFDNCANLKHYAILAILYSTAIRVSEVVNLKITDIDSKSMVIRIKSSKGRKDRLVPLAEKCLYILRKYWLKYRPQNHLFEGQFSEKYTTHSIQLWIKKLAFKAGINKKVYPHLIRHTSLTHNLELGTDIRTLQVIAGHGNIKTTMGYTHISPRFISSVNTPLQSINIKKLGRHDNKTKI